MRTCLFFLFVTCLSANDYLEKAAHCRQTLKSSLVDYYLPAVWDRVNGGYLENWRDGQFVANGEKSLVIQARQLWFFSTLALEGIERETALAAAQAGFAFLEQKMRDTANGGYFAKVTDEGAPKDRRKHLYLQDFALYGLSAYYRATHDPQALAAAQNLFDVLAEKAYDRRYGGFLEFFTEDWIPITHRKTDSPVGPGDIKTYNAHLHTMEALTQLYLIWPDPLLKERLDELLAINTKTVCPLDVPGHLNEWSFDWNPIQTPGNYTLHYGHELEGSWMAVEAARALGYPLAPYQSLVEAHCAYCLKYGQDLEHGGFFYAGPIAQPASNTKKEWWVQAEAMVALLEMYRFTQKEEYYLAFQKTLDFVTKYQVAPGGGWWATCAPDGSPLTNQRTSNWQAAYHNGRSLLLCAKMLEELAAERK